MAQANQTQTQTETQASKKAEKKRNALYECQTIGGMDDPQGVEWKFRNGEVWRMDVAALEPIIVAQATVHGLKQKVNDAAAISVDPETGKPADAATKMAAMREVFERLQSGGPWNMVREGSGEGTMLLRAVIRAFPDKPAEALKAWLDSKTKAEKDALAVKNPKVAKALEEIKAERVNEEVDVDALEDELNQLG